VGRLSSTLDYIRAMCTELSGMARRENRNILAYVLEMAILECGPQRSAKPPRIYSDTVIGVWDWDIVEDRLYADANVAHYFALPPDEAMQGAPIERYKAAIHPDDLQRVSRLIEQVLKTGGEYSAEYRLLGRNETLRWVLARGRVQRDASGKPVRFPGALIDITDEKSLQDEIARSVQDDSARRLH